MIALWIYLIGFGLSLIGITLCERRELNRPSCRSDVTWQVAAILLVAIFWPVFCGGLILLALTVWIRGLIRGLIRAAKRFDEDNPHDGYTSDD